MRIGAASATGAAIAAAMGGGYMASGNPDFTVEVHRSPEAVYAAFAQVNPSDTDFQTQGYAVSHITVTHPSDHELVFTTPSANAGQDVRVAFTFAPGSTPASTKVTAAIDVPPIPMSVDGEDKVLSERKVEGKVRDAIGELAKQIDNGNSTSEASYKLATLLQMVAIASHPKKLQAVVERSEREASEHKRFKEKYESEGWHFTSEHTAERSYADEDR
ncbi:MAG: hypothetical protein JSR96_13330 [Proteobacteria bacterium]|nr:hypothetical protein [Pseudomonadota bacterium]